MTKFLEAVGELPMTFWGVLILFASMYIAVKYNSDTGYYFAGVGSTLCGISKLKQPTMPNTKVSVDPNKPTVEVESNAGDQTN